MKASSKRTCTVTLEMSEEEAEILCALLGGLDVSLDTQQGNTLYEAFRTLDGQLPNRNVSFSSFFTGRLQASVVE